MYVFGAAASVFSGGVVGYKKVRKSARGRGERERENREGEEREGER